MVIFCCTLIFFCFFGCKKTKIQKWSREQFLFGTYIGITVYDSDKERAEKAMDAAFAEIERIDRKFNSKMKDSLIAKINIQKNSPQSPKELLLDAEGVYLFAKVREAYLLSQGEYDVTVGPLVALWGFGTLEESKLRVPTTLEISTTLKKIDFSQVSFTEGMLKIFWPVEEIDTGSFLKGYAIEKAREKMSEVGIQSALITSISSIATIGSKPDQLSWKIGIQDPDHLPLVLGTVPLDGKAMGVSGDYQTVLEINGKKYHHILQKSTGYPVADKKMVVVLAQDAFLADIYSTCFFVMPVDKVLEFLYTINYLDVLIIKSDGEVIVSKNMNFVKSDKIEK
jgi:thiamine biosynthesis lipoprotein